MRISDIQEQKRRANRVSVYIDDDFWTGMSKRTLSDLRLEIGMEIDQAAKTKAEEQVIGAEALSFCVDRLSRRALTEQQLRSKMLEREFAPSVVDQTIVKAHELLLLDDEQLAESRIRERQARGQGKGRVEQVLKEIGIEEKLREKLIEEAFVPEEEFDAAKAVLDKRFQDNLDTPGQQRAFAFLIRRGFSSQVSARAIETKKMNSQEVKDAHPKEEGLDLVLRKYPALDSEQRDRTLEQKARALLMRKGFDSETIREILDAI